MIPRAGAELRQWRRAQGLTQAEAASIVGITRVRWLHAEAAREELDSNQAFEAWRWECNRRRAQTDAVDMPPRSWLATQRGVCELSRAELARAVGASERSVRRWETGASRPQLRWWFALAKALGCGVAELRAGLLSQGCDGVVTPGGGADQSVSNDRAARTS